MRASSSTSRSSAGIPARTTGSSLTELCDCGAGHVDSSDPDHETNRAGMTAWALCPSFGGWCREQAAARAPGTTGPTGTTGRGLYHPLGARRSLVRGSPSRTPRCRPRSRRCGRSRPRHQRNAVSVSFDPSGGGCGLERVATWPWQPWRWSAPHGCRTNEGQLEPTELGPAIVLDVIRARRLVFRN